MPNYINHCITITKHRHMVLVMAFKSHMFYQGLVHDLSKYSFIEFYNGAKYYAGEKSPIGNERDNKGHSDIYLHHKGRNKHHFEYWYDPYSQNNHTTMPDKYILESILDRIAAAKIYLKDSYTNGSALEYFYNDQRITSLMNYEERSKFEYLLKYLKDYGEDELFKLINLCYKRKYIKK